MYAVFALQQHRHFRTAIYDLGLFDQAVRHYAHFQAPVMPAKFHDGLGLNFLQLGDHFSPILALLAPLYWIYPHAVDLLVAQAFLFAIAGIPVWMFVRRRMGARAAYFVTGAFWLSFGLQGALASDFHEIAFAVPLIAFAIERSDAGRIKTAVVAALALLLVKEDMGLIVAAFGIGLAIKGHRRAGLVAFLGGALGFELITRWAMPMLGGHSYGYWAMSKVGNGVGPVLAHIVTHPISTAHLAVTPAVKWHTVLWMFAPLGLMALRSPYTLMVLPVLAERMLGAKNTYWTTGHQYNAVLMPILVLASVDGLLLLHRGYVHRRALRGSVVGRRMADGFVRWWPAAVFATALILCYRFPFHLLATPSEWQTSTNLKAAQQAVAHVPPDVDVVADNRLGAHLVDNHRVLLLDNNPPLALWVVADTRRGDFPFRSSPEQFGVVLRLLVSDGYQVVWDRDGYVVLHRTT